MRRYKRYTVENKNILSRSLMNALVELSDISKTGACIKAYERLQLDGQNFLKLNSVPGLILRCDIVWTHPDMPVENSRRMIVQAFKAGVQFKDISLTKSALLESFLGVQKSQNERSDSTYKPRTPRFKMRISEKAKIYYLRVSMVKKISIGGMLIKTNSAFSPGKKMALSLAFAREDVLTELQGRVASIIPDTSSDGEHFFNVGIEFLNMNRRNQVQLRRFVQVGAPE